ncbi:hypothetical protein [Mycobacterium sp. 1274756.6]|uniref:Rv1893 family protein n=1 Tax=Mycobacterium sp. 1274756.6 TaxID=1834076 RepID=UPI00080177AC|nr:hypothetical protein [Mycobacterium sp. 1274756.6]OBJ69951.1 hypothetical protein A5643_11305 [Mycobacterium sp. 1274756.6]
MAFNPKDALESARDIATHAVEKASDIVENASDIIRGDISGGVSGIVENSIDIGTHAAAKVKEMATGRDADLEDPDDL